MRSRLGMLQGLELFDGPYHSGKACFTYRQEPNGRVYEGNFLYLVDGGLPREKVSLKGDYAHDKKEGRWEYSLQSSHCNCRLKADYQRGMRHGTYELFVCENRMKMTAESQLSLTFRNNHPVGPVKAFVDDYLIEGQCDEHGMADGVWTRQKMGRSKDSQYFVEKWQHGSLLQSFYTSTDMGLTKHKCPDNCLSQIQLFVEEYGQSLERRAAHGHPSWGGNIGKLPGAVTTQ